METHRFYKGGISWYIDLTAYLEQGGSPGDLHFRNYLSYLTTTLFAAIRR